MADSLKEHSMLCGAGPEGTFPEEMEEKSLTVNVLLK
jgi:hypothetical protein